jgi:hypothetical protein
MEVIGITEKGDIYDSHSSRLWEIDVKHKKWHLGKNFIKIG